MVVIEYEKRRTKKIPPIWIAVIIAAIGIIIFAFIWEAGNKQENEFEGYYTEPPDKAVSEMQKIVDGIDWITKDFLPINPYSRPGTELESVRAIVVHYVGNPGTTAKQNRSYFANLSKSAEAYLSSNFIVGLDGEVIQCVPVDEVAYASNSRNGDTLSIETCHPDETGKFNDDTYSSLVRLTAMLCNMYGITADDVIRHYDITGKECPKYYVENKEAWESFLTDTAFEMLR